MKLKYLLFLFVGVLLFFVPPNIVVYAQESTDIEQELGNAVDDTLEDIEFGDLDGLVDDLNDKSNLFGNLSFKEKITGLIKGEYELNYTNLLSCVISLFFDNVTNILPIVLSLVGLAVLSVIIGNFRTNTSGVNTIVTFACYSAAIIVVSSVFYNVIDITSTVLNNLSSQIDVLMPILMSLLVAIGNNVLVSIYKPIVAILSSGVAYVFSKILLPIFVMAFIFTVIGNISKNIKLNKFVDFLSSCFKYIVGFAFTIFSGALMVQGIVANKYDNLSFKATKFAMKSYIPLIGGYISDGLDFVVMSSVLIKNAIGVGGLILILSSVLIPIITIVVLRLALMLVASLIEPLGAKEIGNFTTACVKVLNFPIVLILGVSFMYMLFIGLILCSGNVI